MGSLWMLLAAFLFAGMSVLVKMGAVHFSSTELVFYRSLFGVWATYVIIRAHGFSVTTPHWRIHCWRGVTGLISLLMFFYCLAELPLGTAVSLNYTWPLFLALFSTLILKEHLRWSLVFAILLGFMGVVILLRPALPEDQWLAGVIGIASGFFAAIAYVNVKQLGNLGESEWHVVFYFTLISTLGTGAWLMMTSFSALTWHGLLIILGIGVTATLAQIAMTRAYHTGVTLVVTSLGYSTVLFASLWDLVLWNEVVTPIAWLGIALIVLGGSMGGILGFRGISVSISKRC